VTFTNNWRNSKAKLIVKLKVRAEMETSFANMKNGKRIAKNVGVQLYANMESVNITVDSAVVMPSANTIRESICVKIVRVTLYVSMTN
jgi:hypothetical protein